MTKTNKQLILLKLLIKYQCNDTDNMSADTMKKFLNEIISQKIFFPSDTKGQQDK